MAAGDGRNQALFNYILTLQSNGFSKEEAKECIGIINQYILKEPLPAHEIETILRDEAFEKPSFFNDKTFLFDKFAEYLKNNFHIIKIDNQLHLYHDGIYIDGYKVIESEMIKIIPNLNRQKRTEVLAYLDIMIERNTPRSDAKYIAFRNGVYDIEEDSFVDFGPNMVITNKINFDYNPNAYSKIVDHTLNKLACGDPDIRMLLEEVVGYTFYRRNELRKAFVLTGDKANGKSTYLDMITTLLGAENTAALDLSELGERFKTAELFGKLANIGDDIGDEFIANPAIFKKLVSGDRINAERKGCDPFDFNNYSKLLFSANNMPRIKDKSGAVISRLVMIPFHATFSANDADFDPYIKYKLRQPENIEYLILLGIQGLKRVLKNRRFTTGEAVTKELEEYEENNNPILLFFKETELAEIINQPTKDVYAKYDLFCHENKFNALSNIEFSKKIKKVYDLEIVNKSIGGKKYRIFVRK
jgi:putative DNA primase/helicase